MSAPKGVVSAPGGVSAQGVSAPGGSAPGGCLLQGVSAPRGVYIPACTEADTPPPCGQTHACENITLATSLRLVKKVRITLCN